MSGKNVTEIDKERQSIYNLTLPDKRRLGHEVGVTDGIFGNDLGAIS